MANANNFNLKLTASLDKSKSSQEIQSTINELEKGLTLNLNMKINTEASSAAKKSIDGLKESANGAENAFGNAVTKFAEWQIIGDVIHDAQDAMSDMVQQVFDLDSSLTELSKVTDLSGDSLKIFEQNAFDVAEQIGSTGKDVIDATTIFAQAGYEAKDALNLSEQAIMLKNVSEAGATAAGSAQTLISTLKGFKDEGLDASHVVDSLNEVSNKYAVSVNDLSTGIKKASAAMAANGTTYEQMLGLLTAGTEVMQQPGKIANALSTISARLTTKNDAYIASITHGQGTVDDYTGQLRSTYDVLSDIAKVYPSLTSVEKQELIETVAGKTQKTALTSILSNFNNAIGATETALNSEGSASEENAKRMQSLEGKMNSLNNAWQEFSTKSLNNDAIKGVLEFATNILKLTGSISGLTPIVLGLGNAFLILKGGWITNEIFETAIKGYSTLKSTFTNLRDIIPTATTALKTYNAGIISTSTLMQALSPIFGIATVAITAFVAGIDLYKKHLEDLRNANKEMSETHLKEAADLETLKNKYSELSTKQNLTISENTELSNTIKTLSDNYGIETTNIGRLNIVRQDTINKINEEIKSRKQAAALEKESSIETNSSEKNTLTSTPTGINYNSWASQSRSILGVISASWKALDVPEKLQASNLADLKKKMESYISTMQNKISKTAEEKKTLEQVTKDYSELTGKITTYTDAYSQSLTNLRDGIPITNEEANVLTNLGEITEQERVLIEKYNEAQGDKKQKILDIINNVEKYIKTNNTATDSESSLVAETDSISSTLDTLQKTYKTLSSAVQEYNSNGSVSIDTLQALLQLNPQYLAQLTLQNGKLSLNSNALQTEVEALKVEAIQKLESAAATDIHNLALGKTESMSQTGKDAIAQLGNKVEQVGQQFGAASGEVAGFGATVAQATSGDTGDEEFQKKKNAIISSYQKLANEISSIKVDYSTSSLSGKSNSSKSNSASKKASEQAEAEYKATVDNLYKYKNAVDIAKNEVKSLEDTLKSADSYDKQSEYMRQITSALQNQINKTHELKDAQSNQISDYANQLRNLGFSVDYNSSKNELYINNLQHLTDLSGNTAKSTEKIISEIQSLNSNNVELDTNIRALTNDVSDYNQKLNDIPTEKLSKFNELFEKFQQSQLNAVSQQIKDIEQDEKHDARLNALKKQLEVLEDQTDETKEQEEYQEKLLAVEKAKETLENEKKQKTLQVYRTGQGFVYETDPEKIKTAQDSLTSAEKALSDAQATNTKDALQKQIDLIEKNYTDRKDKLQSFLDDENYKIDKATNASIESFSELNKQLEKYGLNTNEYLSKAVDWINKYNSALSDTQKTVSSLGNTVYSSSLSNILSGANIGGISYSTSGLSASGVSYKIASSNSNSNIYIDKIELPNVKNANDFIDALKTLPGLASSQATQRT